MSYCRWSSDGWRSDVYVYESSDGFEIHVARYKRVHPDPCPTVDYTSPDAAEQDEAADRWLDESRLEPLSLPCDGASFCFATPREAACKLRELHQEGYHIPLHALGALAEEEDPC